MHDVQPLPFHWKFPPDYDVRCSQALNAALNGTPMYQSWRSYDPGPQSPVDIRFASMPALTKKDIREHFPDGVLPPGRDMKAAIARGEIELVQTSGTTDDKITNLWNQKWWDASEKASWKLNSVTTSVATGDHREAILVNPRNVGFISDHVDLTMAQRSLSRFLYLNEKTDPLSWSPEYIERMIDELNTFKPAVLEANPSMLARFCRYIIARGRKVFQPGVIVLTYECPTRFHYRQIKAVFDVPVASSYGSTETGYVFMQCEAGKFHQNVDFCRVDFQPLQVQHGGPLLGRILVTPLGNPWNYFIRFDTGDLVLVEQSGKCSCGRDKGIVLATVAGRVVNLTLTCEGRLVTLLELDNAVDKLKGIEQYQIIQTNYGKYEFHVVTGRKDKAIMKKDATEILTKLYGKDSAVNIIFETDIAPEGSGKYLISKTLFPVKLDTYLDDRYTPPVGQNTE
jgi:phenylacetate-coenzyme A ligase PaaK-like adenylate-forming protein